MPPDHSLDAARLHSFTLGDWLVQPKACLVSRGDTVVKLRPQLVDLLVCLGRRAGEIVLKDEILAEVWPGQYIAESGLSRCVAELRQILQDDAGQPRYIETITKRGYRIVAPVAWMASQAAEALPAAGGPQERRNGPQPAVLDDGPPPVADGNSPRDRRAARRFFGLAAAALMLLAAAIVAGVLLMKGEPARVLTERDPLLLAFENKTGEAVFDETIPLAVSIQLEQSPYLALLSPGRIQEVLRMMKRPPDTAMTRAVGLEVCERAGARALIVTSIARLGAQYVIGLEAVACGTNGVLARRQATTENKEQVLAALQQAAGDIRLAVGETKASLERYRLPIVEATTGSLDALRAVRRGDVARERGQADLALALYREAVALDPDFALAYSRLGPLALGRDRVEALEKAYALRQQVTVPERLEIEASYHRHVTGERAKVVEAMEMLSRSYPHRAAIRRDLAQDYIGTGRYETALSEAKEAVRLEPNSALNIATVARAHLLLNQITEARQAAEQAIALGGTAAELHVALFYCAVAAGDADLLARERAWAAAHPEVPDLFENEAEESLNAGRLGEAIGFLEKYEAWAETNNVPDAAARMRLRMARYEALCGFRERAIRRVEADLRTGLGRVAKVDAVRATVSGGRFDLAERLLNEIEREGPPGEWGATMVRTYRAAIAAGRSRTAEALDLLAPLRPFELGYAYSLEPLFERARTHYLAGEWAEARAAFENILAHQTIDTARKIQPFAELGLARTLARAGDIAGSRRVYQQFLERWRQADPDLPVLLQAKREVAALPE